jgi:hypothetical protein
MPPFYERNTGGYLRLAVVRLTVDFLRPAVVRGLRSVDRLRVAAAFLAAVDRFADLRLRVAAAFFAAADRVVDFLAVDFLAVVLRLRVAAAFLPAVDRFADLRLRVAAAFFAAVDLLRVAAICHLLSPLRTPCASGVVARVR